MRVPIRPICTGLLLAFLTTAGTASAEKLSPRCPSPTPAALWALMHSAPDAVVFEFRGEDAKTGIRIFNSLPPAGQDAGDRFYIAVRPGLPRSRLLIGSHGCIEDSAVVDARIALKIQRAIEKYRAATSI
jgi:hypothetical protein